ncbi:hypothetical protein [Oceanobacillus bengalensis]|uniref:DUF3679 domain-containing protein n=1 Tax=Oceanobacillus bengalensis TaxID=1435466 RepID=A0A494Z5U9_9BACI|nr:hypothetical protein [Oceanobacillus bengalensis]RKQ17864.1 hypothetical protein D8M05_02980 [Oceanobacillus bengalensis]
MVRSIIVLLLFVVFFLSGTLYGMSQDNRTETAADHKSEETIFVPEKTTDIEREEETIVSKSIDEDVMDTDHNEHLTQKTASFLETSVQGFYEVVVQILYQISNLFF